MKGSNVFNRDVNVFFAMPAWEVRDQFWTADVQAHAAKLGFQVRLNKEHGPLTPELWAELLEGVEAVITAWGCPKLDEKVLARNTTLKIVGHAAGSVGGIASPLLYERGIPVLSCNPIMAQAVAEWCLLVTQLMRNRFLDYAGIGKVTDMVWENREQSRAMHDATISVWGYGDISRRLIDMLRPMSPKKILVYSGHMKPEEAAKAGITLVGFDEMFERGDIIHLLGALTDANRGRVGAAQLAKIKDGAVLINAGRAHLVEEQALLAELSKGRFQTVLDVHYTEPLPQDSPFRGMPGVIVTPHVAGRGKESLYVPHILDEFDRFFRGEPLTSAVAQDRAVTMTGGAGTPKRK
ncbi:MAG: hydroxyacid dehydrogenase [Planctomycetes bacterium]|nr:hydroxyacid dehydrogenase [Planctomycetota bacterium]